ncbi:MAG: outer membrane protein assembly factor BamD [Terriglobia bacterium]
MINFRRLANEASRSRGPILGLLLLSVALLPGCLLHFHRHAAGLTVAPGEQPDKILLQKALNEFNHARYTTGRLLLQSLINTYPDSEYLSQAKLAIADSYYKQGGISGLTEAEAEYKDFITFFPTAPEAPEAEYRAGMCHFRLIGTADRDPTEAQDAELEFKQFLLKYPANPLMPEVKDRLREVQEILARGEYEIAAFYYQRQAYPAARSRFKEIVDKYPNFSQGDLVFWDLGQTLAQLRRPADAVPYYDRLIMEFPLSPLVKSAETQLADLHKSIPKPTKAVLARAQADAQAAKRYHETKFQKAFTLVMGTPNFASTLHGPVVLGSSNQIQVEIARLNGPAKTAASAGVNHLSSQTSSVASLNAGKAVDPSSSPGASSRPDPRPPEFAEADKPGQAGAAQRATSAQPAHPNQPEKKKGLFSFFKKLLP